MTLNLIMMAYKWENNKLIMYNNMSQKNQGWNKIDPSTKKISDHSWKDSKESYDRSKCSLKHRIQEKYQNLSDDEQIIRNEGYQFAHCGLKVQKINDKEKRRAKNNNEDYDQAVKNGKKAFQEAAKFAQKTSKNLISSTKTFFNTMKQNSQHEGTVENKIKLKTLQALKFSAQKIQEGEKIAKKVAVNIANGDIETMETIETGAKVALAIGGIALGLSLFGSILGFGKAGIAASSTAASIQGGIGNVAAGSLFATAQSIGATGALTKVGLIGVSGGLTTKGLCKGYKIYHEQNGQQRYQNKER